MLQKILVPIDGTEYSWRALEYAASMAKLSGGTLVVMTVAAQDIIHFNFSDVNRIMQTGNEVLDAACAMLKGQSVTAEYVLETGRPIAERILATQKELDCDAIVLGSRGFGVLEGLLKNSVSRIVAEDAAVPVTIIK